MHKKFKFFLSLILVFSVSISTSPVWAGVDTTSNGPSNGDSLDASDGPDLKKAQVSESGGSIEISRARAIKKDGKRGRSDSLKMGAEVISAGTEGDADITHVTAVSAFIGTATYLGEDVDDFAVNLKIDGKMSCKHGLGSVEGVALAEMYTELNVNRVNKFNGKVRQDGAGVFTDAFGDLDDLQGAFRRNGNNKAKIRRAFPISLGPLTNNQTFPFVFIGAALVSYGSAVPIIECYSDFLKTEQLKPAKGEKGSLDYTEATKLTAGFIDDGDEFTASGNETLFIESDDDTLLNNIDPASILVFVPGDTGSPFSVDGISVVGDVNTNGTNDVSITFDAQNPTALVEAIIDNFNNDAFVFGQTTGGEAFYGKLDLR